MYTTILELCNLFIEPAFLKLLIYDIDKDEILYKGCYMDLNIPEYEELIVESIDNPTKDSDYLIVNVCLEQP